MRITKLIAITFAAAFIAGCDSGNFTEGSCGVKENNKNMVEYGSSQRCKEDDQTTFLALFGTGTASQTVGPKDEARTGVQAKIDADVSLREQQKEASGTAGTIRWAFVSLLSGVIAVAFSIWLYARLVWARATHETNPHDPLKKRYERWAFFVPAVGVLMVAPYPFGEVGKDPYTTFATRFYSVYVNHGNWIEAITASNILSSNQAEGLTTNTLSETSRVYTTTRAKAKSIVGAMVQAELKDLSTSKYQIQMDNFTAPVASRRVEYQDAPQILTNTNGFSLYRSKDGNASFEKALTTTASMDIKTDYNLKASIINKAKLISNTYMTSDADALLDKLKGFKADMISSYNITKPNQEINNAVLVQSAHSINSIFQSVYFKNRDVARKIARLVEEEHCSYPTSSKFTDYQAFSKPQRTYIEYLKGTKAESAYENSISCIGEPSKGNYVVYGMRSREAVEAESVTAIAELLAIVEPVVEKIQAAQILAVIDETNSSACVDARKHLGPGFAANYSSCLRSTKQNKDMIKAISNYSFSSDGGGSYVDTSMAFLGNQNFNSMMDINYDPIVNNLLASIESKASIREMDSTEYVENMMQNNMGDESGLMANLSYILNPFAEIRKDMGFTESCRDAWYKCIDGDATYIALNNVGDRMIEAGSFISFSSIIISQVASKIDKSSDKSREGTQFSSGKKEKNPKSKLLKSFEFATKQLASIGFIIMVSGFLIKYILAAPTLVFVIAFVMLIIEILVKLLMAPARFMFLFSPMDADNRNSAVLKLLGEYVYMVSIKSVLMLLQALFFLTYGMILFTVCMVCVEKAEQGFVDAIYMAIVIVPVLYAMTMGYLKAYFMLIAKIVELCGGNETLVEGIKDVTDMTFNVVTFGLPLWLIWATRKR